MCLTGGSTLKVTRLWVVGETVHGRHITGGDKEHEAQHEHTSHP